MKLTQNEEEHYLKKELYGRIKADSIIFDFIQEGSLDGIWYWDLENPENEWMSPKFWTEFGYEPSDMPHRSDAWQDIIFKEDLQMAIENFEKHCSDPTYPYDQIVRYRHKNGSTVWIRCRGIAIRDKEGKPIRMLGAHNNVTEIKLAEQKLSEEYKKVKDLNNELAIKNQDLEYFANIAAHDLKEPARVISGYIDMIQEDLEGNISEEIQHYMNRAVEGAKRMSRLLDDLLDITRLDKNKLRLSSVNLGDLIDDLLIDLGEDISDLKGQIVHNLDGKIIFADKNLMYSLLSHLIRNGLKFHRNDVVPEIKIELQENEQEWIFNVSDNGIGIEEKYFDRIFLIFQRLHTRSEFTGTGVGLSICKKIAELHGGSITCTSILGKGSTFSVKIKKRDE